MAEDDSNGGGWRAKIAAGAILLKESPICMFDFEGTYYCILMIPLNAHRSKNEETRIDRYYWRATRGDGKGGRVDIGNCHLWFRLIRGSI
jgi:hypothetical protein